jgi:hypothetical protein
MESIGHFVAHSVPHWRGIKKESDRERDWRTEGRRDRKTKRQRDKYISCIDDSLKMSLKTGFRNV